MVQVSLRVCSRTHSCRVKWLCVHVCVSVCVCVCVCARASSLFWVICARVTKRMPALSRLFVARCNRQWPTVTGSGPSN